jgi:hypothetical protein
MFFLFSFRADSQILRQSQNDKNRNLKNAVTSALSNGYKSKTVRKTSWFKGAFWVRQGRRFCRKYRRDKGLILD